MMKAASAATRILQGWEWRGRSCSHLIECMDDSEKRRSADSRWLEMTGITVFLISS